MTNRGPSPKVNIKVRMEPEKLDTTTANSAQVDAPKSRRAVHDRGGNAVKSELPALGLPKFIGQILSQYQDLLVEQVEREVKKKAFAAVKEEARLLEYRARERFHFMESEVHQRAQILLDRAHEGIFEMVRQELGAVIAELEANLRTLLEDMDIRAEAEVPPSEDGHPEMVSKKPLETGATTEIIRPLKEGVTSAVAPQGMPHQEVRLELPPPLDLRSTLGFVSSLSQMEGVRVLRSLGSLDKGVSVFVQPKRPSSLVHLLEHLPGVTVVAEEGSEMPLGQNREQELDDYPTLHILLQPYDPKAERGTGSLLTGP